MDKNEERLVRRLTGEISRDKKENCPPLEDISALIDGSIEKNLKKSIQNHIASCDECYEIYITASKLTKRRSGNASRIFSTWSIAATIFIALVSFALFFKVNVREEATKKAGPELIRTAPAIMEYVEETESLKLKKGVPKRSKAKDVKPGKVASFKKELSLKEKDEDFTADKGSETRSRRVVGRSAAGRKFPANVQGVSQAGIEPPEQSPPVPEQKDEEEKVAPTPEYTSLKSVIHKEKGKGLVDRLIKNKSDNIGEGNRMDCFKGADQNYERREEFKSDIRLRDSFPEIVKFVQPENFKADDIVVDPVYIILEVFTDKGGNVLKVCIADGSISNRKAVIEAVKKWKFSIKDNSPARFRIVLGVSGSRIIEILDRK
ncbi:MAG: hypothetical protein KAR14_01420 [Candidatus Aminicenantes bacterium]|nr:hypothetical protein [Candidatus Aminicenantes bacterium]